MERRRRLADRLAVAAGELLPHGLDHLPGSGDHLQRLGDVLAQLAQARAAAAVARRRRLDHHPITGKMLGEGVALSRPLAGETGHGRGLGHRQRRGDLIFRGAGLQLFELQLHLIRQPRRALRCGAVNLPLKLGDPQLLMGDQRQILGPHGLGDRQLRIGGGPLSDRGVLLRDGVPRPRLGADKRHLQRLDIVGKGLKIGVHDQDGITKIAACGAPKCGCGKLFCAYPAAVGRQLICGLRQSIPSSR